MVGGHHPAEGERQMFDCTPQILIMCRDFIRRGAHYTPAALRVGDGDAEHRPLQIICWLATHYKMFCKIKLAFLEGDRRDRALFVRSGAAGEG